MQLLIGIDVGTTGTKTMIINEQGNIISSSYKGYDTYSEELNYVEQDAQDWWDAVVYTVRECMYKVENKDRIKAISLSSQGGSMVPVDQNCNPLRRAIVWMDKRAVQQGKDLRKGKPKDYFYKKTGWRLSSGLNLAQIKWVKDNQPEIFKNTHKFLSTIDFINYKLTGEYVIDLTNAGITHLADLEKREWNKEILEEIEIDQTELADLNSSGEIIGNLTKAAAEQLGLPANVKVISGGHDQYCVALGAGAVNKGDVLLATGTAWAVIGIFDQLLFDTKAYFSPGYHVVKDKYGAMSTVGTGGISMEWFRKNIANLIKQDDGDQLESYQNINKKAGQKGIGADGLMFYPHFLGSGCPTWSSDNRATILGLDLSHDRYHIARAIMEGVAFEANWILEALKEKDVTINKLKMLGGATNSKLWTQIIANITGVPIIIPEISDAACVGAAMLAGLGIGMFEDAQKAYQAMVKDEREILPIKEQAQEYKALFQQYKKRFYYLKQLYGVSI
ncbi:MAG: FGGY family carbohydrate kinase [Clostridia bacterium]|nr:FGGY family carbohydrate kinase [Clostridia bacterium]